MAMRGIENKRAQGASIETVIGFVLGAIVLVLAIFYFTGNFDLILNLFFRENVDKIIAKCDSFCDLKQTYNYCEENQKVVFSSKEKEQGSCYALSLAYSYFPSCPFLDCQTRARQLLSDSKYDLVEGNTMRSDKPKISQVLESAKNLETTKSSRSCNCGTSCDDYAGYLIAAAQQVNSAGFSKDPLDPLLIAALLMQETNCNAQAGFPYTTSGKAYGLAQIVPSVWCGKTPLLNSKTSTCVNQLKSAETSILSAADILKKNYRVEDKLFEGACIVEYSSKKYSGWAAALRGYVGWGCAEGHDSYVTDVVLIYTQLKEKYGQS